MKELPLYFLDIDEDTPQSGVDCIAFVDVPAILMSWQAFSAHKEYTFSVQDVEKRMVAGPVMVADMPIYRRDPDGFEYYAAFNAKSIERINNKYHKYGYQASFNEMHNSKLKIKDTYMVQSFLINRETGVNPPKGYETLPDGSWFFFAKVENDAIWEKVKNGDFTGFSVEGMFGETELLRTDQKVYDSIVTAITGL